jgi:hypothetical protein
VKSGFVLQDKDKAISHKLARQTPQNKTNQSDKESKQIANTFDPARLPGIAQQQLLPLPPDESEGDDSTLPEDQDVPRETAQHQREGTPPPNDEPASYDNDASQPPSPARRSRRRKATV